MGTFTSRLNDLLDCKQVLFLHSCNGLLCIAVTSVFDDSSHYDGGRKLVVFNPTTNQRRIIHREKKLAVEKHRAINIIFDPSKSDDYMIVCVLVYDKKEFRFKVYSSETGVWSETGVTFRKRGVRTISKEGCFGMVVFIGSVSHQDYSEWVVKHCIDIAPLITLYPSTVVDDYEPIYRERFHLDMPCFVVDEKEKETMPVISIEGKLIAYEINNMTVKEFAKVDFGDLSKGRALITIGRQLTSTLRH